jgi:hypothetical protein
VVLRIEALRERLAKLEEVVSRLRELPVVSREEFGRDYRHQWLAERGLELTGCVELHTTWFVLSPSLC